MKARRESGFTIVELLLAVGIFAVLLGLLAALLSTSFRAYGANELNTQQQERIDAAAQFLRYDINLAGYAGPAGDRNIGGYPIEIIENRVDLGDKLTVRYHEDRYGLDSAVQVSYFANDDGLVRDAGTGPEVVARGVSTFKVINSTATSVQLEIVQADRSYTLAVAFAHPERVNAD